MKEVRCLVLRYVSIEGEPDPNGDSDHWLTCLLCERPRRNVNGVPVGKPVQYVVTLLGDGQTRGYGLHERCVEKMQRWQKQMRVGACWRIGCTNPVPDGQVGCDEHRMEDDE